MQALFKPSVAVLNRLRYPAKFLLIGSVVAVILAVFLFTIVTQLNRDITAAKNEVAGLGMLKPMNRLVQAMQQHRGLSSGVLNGNEAMKDKRAAKEKEVADFLSASETALSPELRAHADWKAVRDEWEVIRTQGLNWSAGDNVKRHTALIDRVLLFMVTVADATELTLDPVMDTYYMMDTVVQKMPALLEPLGVTRARGTGVLSKKELAPELKVAMAATLGQLSQTLRAQNINLGKVMDKVPATRPVLEPAAKQLTAEVDALLALVREDVLSERFQTTSDDYFKQATTVIDHGYQVMRNPDSAVRKDAGRTAGRCRAPAGGLCAGRHDRPGAGGLFRGGHVFLGAQQRRGLFPGRRTSGRRRSDRPFRPGRPRRTARCGGPL